MKSILESLKSEVDKVKWESGLKKEKALSLIINIYNLYIYDKGDFHTYKSLSKEYFYSILGKKSAYQIRNILVDSSILETNGSYNVAKGKGKGWRFNQKLIGGYYVIGDVSTMRPPSDYNVSTMRPSSPKESPKFIFSDNYNNLYNLDYHICVHPPEDLIYQRLQKVIFSDGVDEKIENYSIPDTDIIINDSIDVDYIDVVFEDDSYRYSIEKARQLSIQLNKDLILWKGKGYIESIESFKKRKEEELKLIFRKNIFDIKNGLYRASRNNTNGRLDYNLTNMKSELLDYMIFDGEETVELDISNAQFAILSFITEGLDFNFIQDSKSGNLYKDNKSEWFRVAFDKIKSNQDNFRILYPKTMNFIDSYKSEYGYKSFSNLLQKTESKIIIDYLLPRLTELGFETFPIHDAMRVKKSESEIIKKEIDRLFSEIGFECNLRIKSKKETQIINYKGFKEVEIEKITKEDKKVFISKINDLKDIHTEVSEEHIYGLNLWSKEKSWYLFDKWLKSNPYKEYIIKE